MTDKHSDQAEIKQDEAKHGEIKQDEAKHGEIKSSQKNDPEPITSTTPTRRTQLHDLVDTVYSICEGKHALTDSVLNILIEDADIYNLDDKLSLWLRKVKRKDDHSPDMNPLWDDAEDDYIGQEEYCYWPDLTKGPKGVEAGKVDRVQRFCEFLNEFGDVL